MDFKDFKDFNESVKYDKELFERLQLKHLTHAEDLVWIYGKKGGEETIDFLEITLKELEGHKSEQTTQQKVDGAPAVIAGWAPEDGRFFVATKSLFNKTPKINYSNEDIDINHGHAEGLASKLKEALKYLPSVIKKGKILMGDFMYSKSDLKLETIEGVKGVSYKPNTITYFVDSTSGLYKKIINSQIGVIFHTTYTGNKITELNGAFNISDNDLKDTKDVYARTTNVKSFNSVTFSEGEKKLYQAKIAALKKSLNKFDTKDLDYFINNPFISSEIQTYINYRVREGKTAGKNEIKNLMDFVSAKFDKKIDKLKSEKGKAKAQAEKAQTMIKIREGASTIYHLFKWFEDASTIKMLLLDKLNQVRSPESPYIQTANGYVITDPEGYVISSSSESGVKFVNRHVFSKINMLGSEFNK